MRNLIGFSGLVPNVPTKVVYLAFGMNVVANACLAVVVEEVEVAEDVEFVFWSEGFSDGGLVVVGAGKTIFPAGLTMINSGLAVVVWEVSGVFGLDDGIGGSLDDGVGGTFVVAAVFELDDGAFVVAEIAVVRLTAEIDSSDSARGMTLGSRLSTWIRNVFVFMKLG